MEWVGFGFIGKNVMLILCDFGNWLFLVMILM